MSGVTGPSPTDLRIDDVCERFETAWREGTRLPLRIVLEEAGLAEADRPRLFLELLLLELELRVVAGEFPERNDYLAHFPEFAPEVEVGFTSSRGEPVPLAVTDTVARYQLIGPLAQGGLGRIYRVRDMMLDRAMALKEVRPDCDGHDARARLIREAKLNGRLEHPGVAPVFGLGCHPDGRPFYVMRLIQGETLGNAITRFHTHTPSHESGRRPLTLHDLLSRFASVCDVIDYAHSRGVIHRDLKPANIMLGRFGETLVVDWGLARAFGASCLPANMPQGLASESGFETALGLAVGTPHYMSPEQAAGQSDSVGPSSDIYSLGATLYDILTGRPPYGDSGKSDEVLRRVALGNFVPPRRVKPGVSRAIEAVCLKAMALSPDDRYSSARALADDVRNDLAGEPVTVRAEPCHERAERWVSRHMVRVASTLSALLVALAMGIAVTVRIQLREIEVNNQTSGRITTIEKADSDELPGLIKSLDSDRARYAPLLEERFRDPALTPEERLHIALALRESGGDVRDFLYDRLFDADYSLLPLVWKALEQPTISLIDRLWDEVQRGDWTGNPRPFRAALALARLESEEQRVARRQRWEAQADSIVAACLSEIMNSPSQIDVFTRTFKPVKDALFRPLAARFRDTPTDVFEPARATRRMIAAKILDGYVGDSPELLAELIPDTIEGRRRTEYVDQLRDKGQPAVDALTKILERSDSELTYPSDPADPERRAGLAARRKGRVATALLELGEPLPVWRLLAASEDPTVRTELIHRLPAVGLEVLKTVARRLEATTAAEPRIRQALILMLGEPPPESIPAPDLATMTDRLMDLFRVDPDPGVHGAIEWLLRHKWGQSERLNRVADVLKRCDPASHCNWYINGQDQTFTVIRGPVTSQLGSPPGEVGRDDSEARRTCRIEHSFALATREVTLGEFLRYSRDTRVSPPPLDDPEFLHVMQSDDVPVVGVSWIDAAAYCNWLSLKEGIPEAQWCYSRPAQGELPLVNAQVTGTGYRLPSEAEWELACRAGSRTTWPFGAAWDWAGAHGWFLANAGGRLHPVGQLHPNGLGLFDLLGNAAEWTGDRFRLFPEASLAGNTRVADQPEPTFDRRSRVVKGGSALWPERPRSAQRDGSLPTNRSPQVGFRVARTVP